MKKTLILGGIMVRLLAGAAYIGGQSFSLGGNNSNGVHIDRGDIQPAKELPQTPADVD